MRAMNDGNLKYRKQPDKAENSFGRRRQLGVVVGDDGCAWSSDRKIKAIAVAMATLEELVHDEEAQRRRRTQTLTTETPLDGRGL